MECGVWKTDSTVESSVSWKHMQERLQLPSNHPFHFYVDLEANTCNIISSKKERCKDILCRDMKNYIVSESIFMFNLSSIDNCKLLTHAFISKVCPENGQSFMETIIRNQMKFCDRTTTARDWRGKYLKVLNTDSEQFFLALDVCDIEAPLIQTSEKNDSVRNSFTIRSAFLPVCPITKFFLDSLFTLTSKSIKSLPCQALLY